MKKRKKKYPLTCCICGEPIMPQFVGNSEPWLEGHNARPVADGRCCTICNDIYVLPMRLQQVISGVKTS